MPLESLEFLLDLDAKMDGMVDALGVMGKSIKSLHDLDKATMKMAGGLDKVDRLSRHAGEGHGKHAHAALNLGHAFDNAKEKAHGLLEAMGMMLVFEGIERAADKVAELGREIVTAAGKAERTDRSFKLLLGEEGGAALLEWVEKIAKYTEFTDDRLKSQLATLSRVGMRGMEAKRALAGALDIAALPGGNLEEAVGALERLKRTGHVDNRTLGGMGFGEKDFFAQLSKRTGLPGSVLKANMEKGKFDSMQALESLYDLIHQRTGKALGSVGVDMSKTLQGRMTHLADLPDQFFQGLAKSPAFQKFSDTIGKVLEKLDPDSPAGKRIFQGLDTAFTKFVDVMQKVDLERFSNTMVRLFEKLPPLIEQTTNALLELSKVTARMFGVTGPGAVGAGGHPLSNKALDQVPGWKDSLKLNPDQQKGIAGFQNWAKRWLHIGNGATDAMTNGLLEDVDKVDDAGAKVGRAALEGAAGPKGVDAHSPSRLFEDLGRMSGEGYVLGLESSADHIDAAMARVFAPDSVPPGAFARPAGGGGAFGSVQVVVQPGAVVVTTNVGGHGASQGDAQQLGEEVAQRVESLLPSALVSAFERIRQKLGA